MFGPNGYNNLNPIINPSPSCMTQEIGVHGGDHGLFFGESGVFSGVNIGAEAEMFVPPLESISTTEESYKTDQNSYNNIVNNITSIVNCNNNMIKAENLQGHHGVENFFQTELTAGEWDLDDLMKDVSSFPFLDFQIE